MKNPFKWKHFEGEIILWLVRWYCRYALSYKDLQEMAVERNLELPDQLFADGLMNMVQS